MDRAFIMRHLVPRPAETTAAAPPGLYHYQHQFNGQPVRYHLRVEPDGSGMLIANATAAAQLTPVGVTIALGVLRGDPEHDILRKLGASFRNAPKASLDKDLAHVKKLLETLASPGDIYPIANLEDAAFSAHGAQLMAPLEAWIPAGTIAQIGPLLRQAWDAAIPHVTLLVEDGFSPTDLVQSVELAEEIGLLCGVSGRATPLMAHPGLLEQLAAAGVDHVNVFYASHHAEIHDAYFGAGDHAAARQLFAKTQELQVADVGHIPLLKDTVGRLEETLESLLLLRVPNAAIFAIASAANDPEVIPGPAMRQIAAQVEEEATEARVRYIWEVPVQRDPALPLIDQVRAGPRCGSDFAIRVELGGAVIPPRGPYQIAGNLLHDAWQDIWNHPAFKNYRERVQAPNRCDICPGLAVCAAECPAEPAGWSSRSRSA